MVEQEELNEGHYNEIGDRTWVIQEMVDTILTKHPAIMQNENLKRQVDEIQSKLGKLYQDIGQFT